MCGGGNVVFFETATDPLVDPQDLSLVIEDVDPQGEGIENRLKNIEVYLCNEVHCYPTLRVSAGGRKPEEGRLFTNYFTIGPQAESRARIGAHGANAFGKLSHS